MKFQFETLSEFFVMGGHGGFVFASFGVSILVLIYLVLAPKLERSRFVKHMHSKAKRETQHQPDEVLDAPS